MDNEIMQMDIDELFEGTDIEVVELGSRDVISAYKESRNIKKQKTVISPTKIENNKYE